MSADERSAADIRRDPMSTRRTAGIFAGVALVAGLGGWWLCTPPERVRPPFALGARGVWFRADAMNEGVWENGTFTKRGFVRVAGRRAPAAVGDLANLENPREGPGWLTGWLPGTWGAAVYVFDLRPVTVVESRTVDGTTWLRAVNSLTHLPADAWCPPDLAGDWDLAPAPGTPARLRLHPDGTLEWGPDENWDLTPEAPGAIVWRRVNRDARCVNDANGTRLRGTWGASGPDLFLDAYSSRSRIGARGIGHLRLSPDHTRIEPGTTLRWTGVRRR